MELVNKIDTAKIIKYTFFAFIGTIILAISAKVKITYYLFLNFILAAFFSGYINYSKNIFTNFMKIIFSTSFIYIWSAMVVGILRMGQANFLIWGLNLFLLAELFKVTLLSFGCKNIKIRKFI